MISGTFHTIGFLKITSQSQFCKDMTRKINFLTGALGSSSII